LLQKTKNSKFPVARVTASWELLAKNFQIDMGQCQEGRIQPPPPPHPPGPRRPDVAADEWAVLI
jgi:hypothetical protein